MVNFACVWGGNFYIETTADMGRIQEKREFERKVAYDRYVALSKMAARLFWILMAFGLYLGYTLLEKHQAFEHVRGQWRGQVCEHYAMQYRPPGSSFCPVPVEPEPVFGFRFEGTFKLPFLDIELPATVFLFLGPAAFFLFTLFYWTYLSHSLRAFKRLHDRLVSPTEVKPSVYPSLYNLPVDPLLVKLFWQAALELLPIAVMGVLVSGYLYRYPVALLLAYVFVFALISALIHISVFRVAGSRVSFSEPVGLLMAVWLVAALMVGFSPLFPAYAESFGAVPPLFAVFATLFAFVAIEFVVFGCLFLLAYLVFPIALVVLSPLYGFSGPWKELLRLCSYCVRKLHVPLLYGYVTYFRERYRELKRLERG